MAPRQQRIQRRLHAFGTELRQDDHARHPLPVHDDGLHHRASQHEGAVANPVLQVGSGEEQHVAEREAGRELLARWKFVELIFVELVFVE